MKRVVTLCFLLSVSVLVWNCSKKDVPPPSDPDDPKEEPSDTVSNPKPEPDFVIGDRCAWKMPYTRYDSFDAAMQNGAYRISSPDFDREQIASQATHQEYVVLPTIAAQISWTVTKKANALTVRFTLPDDDTKTGAGTTAKMGIYLNGVLINQMSLTSYWAYQYFNRTNPNLGVPYPDGTGNRFALMCFDEAHTLLTQTVNPGDVISLRRTDGMQPLGVDFIELEWADPPIQQPAGSVSVESYGVVPNTSVDNYSKIVACLNASGGKTIYFPPGQYNISQRITLNGDGTTLQGAGIWYTTLYFTSPDAAGGGIAGSASNLTLTDMYLNTVNSTRSDDDVNRGYHAVSGAWLGNSVIQNLWEEHFEVGLRIGEQKANPRVSTVSITNVRMRDNYAAGANLTQGTSNSTMEQCDVRNCGDDCLACYSSSGNNGNNPTVCTNNTFRYCTVELGWRASGIGIFGGSGHKIYNIYVGEMLEAAGARFTSDFDGHPFATSGAPMQMYNCLLYKTGARQTIYNNQTYGALTFRGQYYPVTNIVISDVDVIDSQMHGVLMEGTNVQGVVLDNIRFSGAGTDHSGVGYGVWADSKSTTDTGSATITNCVFKNCPSGDIMNVNNSYILDLSNY